MVPLLSVRTAERICKNLLKKLYHRKKRKLLKLMNTLPPKETQEDFGYDGYYDDIVPSDIDREREGIDKELVKRIAVIAGAVLIIISLCIVALYLL